MDEAFGLALQKAVPFSARVNPRLAPSACTRANKLRTTIIEGSHPLTVIIKVKTHQVQRRELELETFHSHE
ncbi:conserved hypothetical protein [Ricinus communis]|uniref:Uncharacterized protein n=1 Tax=Ricinus communis TaxID=3988 RepID=B9SJ96_RICCO|nr:conserved hypothetical protein [Ricinus communis]